MASITITEALAEIKTITKRIEKKREFIRQFLSRQDLMKDPLEGQGGSRVAIEQERQAIADLNQRLIAIRRAIQTKNEAVMVTIGADEHSIADWLVWKREVAPGVAAFYSQIRNQLSQTRAAAQQKGLAVRDGGAEGKPTDIIVNVDEKGLADDMEKFETVVGNLDGQLSLKNATVTIDV